MKIQQLKNKVSEIKTSLDGINHKTGQKKSGNSLKIWVMYRTQINIKIIQSEEQKDEK